MAGMASAQMTDSVAVRSLIERKRMALNDNTAKVVQPVDTMYSKIVQPWKPDPAKAVWLGAIVPGLGQIYNRKYWKLPIVYGGFMGCAYAISWNGGMYSDYKKAYRDIIDTDETTNSFMDVLPKGYTLEMMGGVSGFTSTLKTRQDRYHRYRDISIVATVLVYALSLVDAYVDAQLYDFDISPDLTLQVQPNLMIDPYNNHRKTAELQLSFNF